MDRIEREKIFHDTAFLDDVRRPTHKYYSVTERSKDLYISTLRRLATNHDVVEIGCGTGGQAIELARLGGRVCGADVSSVALDRAKRAAEIAGLRVDFQLANAETMPFADGKFDLVYGSGILHHLDLSRICAEIARVLKPNGWAVFYEPLGHNPLINLYRKLTPRLRSDDEHPLLLSDMDYIASFFEHSDIHYFHAFSLATVPLYKTRLFRPALDAMERLDAALFNAVPYSRRFAWMTLLVMRHPTKRHQPE